MKRTIIAAYLALLISAVTAYSAVAQLYGQSPSDESPATTEPSLQGGK
jgi:hypothetical protein